MAPTLHTHQRKTRYPSPCRSVARSMPAHRATTDMAIGDTHASWQSEDVGYDDEGRLKKHANKVRPRERPERPSLWNAHTACHSGANDRTPVAMLWRARVCSLDRRVTVRRVTASTASQRATTALGRTRCVGVDLSVDPSLRAAQAPTPRAAPVTFERCDMPLRPAHD